MKNICVFLTLLIILNGCEKTITNFHIPEKPTKMVINGVAQHDSIMLLNISKSLSFYDERKLQTIDNATISLFNNGNEYGTFQAKGEGWYLSNQSFSRIGAYVLRASAPGFETISVQFSIPATPEIIQIDSDVRQETYSDCPDCHPYYALHTSLTFKDRPDENNYYKVELTRLSSIEDYYYNEYGDSFSMQPDTITTPWIYQNKRLHIYSSSIAIEAVGGDWYYLATPDAQNSGEFFILSDTYFPGEEYTLNFRLDITNSFNFYNDTIQKNQFVVLLNLFEIDENYYDYIKNFAAIQQTNNNPLTEPVTPEHFVENGFGVVLGSSLVQDTIDLLELEPELENYKPYEGDYYTEY